MSNRLKYSLLSSVIISLMTFSAGAQLKIDASGIVGRVNTLASQIQGNIADVQKQVEHNTTFLKVLDGAKEGMSKIKDAKQAVADVQGKIGEASAAVNGAVNAASGAVAEAKGMADSAGALQLTQLQTELAQNKQNYEQQVKELESQRDAELKKYQENNQVYEKVLAQDPSQRSTIQSQIDENNSKIQEINEKYNQQIQAKKAAYEAADNEFMKKIDELKQATSNIDPLSNVSADSAKKAVSGLFGGDSGSAMNEIIAENFYAAEEQPSVDRNGEIVTYRQNTFLNDTADVYYQAISAMTAGDSELEYAKKMQDEARSADTVPAGVTLDISMKVAQMRQLLALTKIMIAELKMETAKNMLAMPKQLNNYEKDVQTFNLDDYNQKPKDNWKKLKEAAKNVNKDTIKDAASTVNGLLR